MTVTQYIGARYVPLFADPLEWDSAKEYEPLTIVQYQGASYTSRQAVPIGININDTNFWALTGNYNAQVEQYRAEVRTFDGRITQNAENIAENTEKIETNTDDIQEINADNWVTEARIANGAVTHDKIGEGAVSSINLSDGSIGLVDLNDNVKQRIANKNFRYSNFVLIGDSYGRGVGAAGIDEGWAIKLMNILGIPESRYVNVSNSGAGFIAQGHSEGLSGLTFSTQLDYAEQHLPENVAANDVDYVIIAGGYNDHAQTSQVSAANSTCAHAKALFPNAHIMFFPLLTGDRQLTTEYQGSYYGLMYGAAQAGATVNGDSMYWLYPFQNETSAGDNIHPNASGYQRIAEFIAATLNGGSMPANARTWGASAEGFSIESGVSSQGFRCGVQQGFAWFCGKLRKTGGGGLVHLPSYCRPTQTQYFYGFAYAGAESAGPIRLSLGGTGVLSAIQIDGRGSLDNTLTYDFYIPMTVIPLGNLWV